jgi:NAD(P)-dependent dehydrogenase (short-subunit alcohol dehydrogenase family)
MMTTSDRSDETTIVVGASRGLGRGIATAFAEAGARVIAVARSLAGLAELADGAGNIQREVADASDATVAGSLLDRHEPQAVILVAGATPLMRPLQHQTWDSFSVNWQSDVRIAFSVGARGSAQATASRQQGGHGQQRRRARGIAAQRRVRLRQGHPALHQPTPGTRPNAPGWASPSRRCCPGSRR